TSIAVNSCGGRSRGALDPDAAALVTNYRPRTMNTIQRPRLPKSRAGRLQVADSRRASSREVIPQSSQGTPVSTLDEELLLKVLTGLLKGDFTVRMPTNLSGLAGKIADTLNGIIENELRLTREFTRVAQVVGKEGKMSQRVHVGNAVGSWAEKLEAINNLI